MNIQNELKNNSILILIIPTTTYSKVIMDTAKQISKNSVCYITLNKTYKSLIGSFKKHNIDTKNMYFIDGITNVVIEKSKDSSKCIFLGAPNKLNELNINISKVLESGKIKYMLFDSLSTLLIYEKPMTVVKFAHALTSKLRSWDIAAVFSILKEDITPDLSKSLYMFADKVVDLSDSKERKNN